MIADGGETFKPRYQHDAALRSIEMAFTRAPGIAYCRGPQDATGAVLCGSRDGRAFLLVVHGIVTVPGAPLMRIMRSWQGAGAIGAVVGTIREALEALGVRAPDEG